MIEYVYGPFGWHYEYPAYRGPFPSDDVWANESNALASKPAEGEGL